jgi:hypothetical protein
MEEERKDVGRRNKKVGRTMKSNEGKRRLAVIGVAGAATISDGG